MCDYIDGTLDAENTIALTTHLDLCPDCCKELSELKQTIALVKKTDVPDPTVAIARVRASLHGASAAMADASLQIFKTKRTWNTNLMRSAFASCAVAATCLFLVYRTTLREPGSGGNGISRPDGLVQQTTVRHGLPTSNELDEMVTLHAIHSLTVSPGEAGLQEEALAEANSRLSDRTGVR